MRYGLLPFIFIKMPNSIGSTLRRRPSLSTVFYCRLVLNWNKSRLFRQCSLALPPTGFWSSNYAVWHLSDKQLICSILHYFSNRRGFFILLSKAILQKYYFFFPFVCTDCTYVCAKTCWYKVSKREIGISGDVLNKLVCPNGSILLNAWSYNIHQLDCLDFSLKIRSFILHELSNDTANNKYAILWIISYLYQSTYIRKRFRK